jgi:hypothetical protein
MEEVKHFCKPERIEAICVEVEGVLPRKGRILDCMNFSKTGKLPILTQAAGGEGETRVAKT